jgi:hypothetical protein
MSKNNEVNKSSRQNNAIKHLVAMVVAGFPFLLGGVLTLVNPEYMARLIMPDPRFQPFGWLLSLGLCWTDIPRGDNILYPVIKINGDSFNDMGNRDRSRGNFDLCICNDHDILDSTRPRPSLVI